MRLYLARHAQTLSNVGHALDTAYPGAALTDLGQEQAARLAARQLTAEASKTFLSAVSPVER